VPHTALLTVLRSKLPASVKVISVTLITRRPSPAVLFTATRIRVAKYVRLTVTKLVKKSHTFNGFTTALLWPYCGPSQSGSRSLGRGVVNTVWSLYNAGRRLQYVSLATWDRIK
jgi:hypothetical protein